MWTRAELKGRAKIAFKRNYWKCVLAAFVLSILTALTTGTPTSGLTYEETTRIEYEDGSYKEITEVQELAEKLIDNPVFITFTLVFVLIALITGFILTIFVIKPIEVGGCRYFTENTYRDSNVGQLFFTFHKGLYMNTVETMFFRELYTALWSLLFLIPGIIKSYEYRMIPYLLADDPNMPREAAFRISKEMMDGQKMDAFLLDLSFIGWSFVAVITCGIAGLFYVNPYLYATKAELFVTLRHNYFARQQFNKE